jgi:hypothetical protein
MTIEKLTKDERGWLESDPEFQMWDVRRKVLRIIDALTAANERLRAARQPAAPDTDRRDECGCGHAGCPRCDRPAAPACPEAEHKPVDAFGGCGVATCALCYQARTEAERAVLDAMCGPTESPWCDYDVVGHNRAELLNAAIIARRGLK